MKYRLIGSGYTFIPKETVLENRGITEDLFNLGEFVIEDYNNYDNMQEGIELLIKHIENKNEICIIVDCDVDGLTSASILYNYLKETFKNINLIYKMHKGKEHGLSKDITIEDDIKLVVLPDASSNDHKQHEDLHNRQINVLVLDHHLCDIGYSEYATVINNQLSTKVKNKNASGAFVVYKFIKAMDDYLFENNSSKYLDLVALGNIADVIDLKEKETRYYVKKGLNNIENLFFKALIESNAFDLDGKLNIEKIGWTIAPKLNGTIRSGTMEEKDKMFQAFISDDYEFCLEVAKMCKNIKTRQDNAVKSAMKKIELKVNVKENDRCIILDVGKNLDSNHTGLVANKIMDKYKLPTLLYRENSTDKDIIGGSFRGIEGISNDLKYDILNSGLALFSEGHEMAGGWSIKKNDLFVLKEYLNNLYRDKELIDSKEYLVDFEITQDEIDMDFIGLLGDMEDEFGNGIDIPLIAFKDIDICITDENIKGLNIIFYINDIKFIKKFSTNVLKDSLRNTPLTLDFIGKCVKDTYNNSYMVEVVEFGL